MITNKTETTATATAPQGVKPHRLIKLGVDVHWRQYVVVRQIDGVAPQSPQRFTPEEFVAWARKQTQLADEVHCCYEAGPFGFVRFAASKASPKDESALVGKAGNSKRSVSPNPIPGSTLPVHTDCGTLNAAHICAFPASKTTCGA
jgi:hypothetical protein